MMINFGNPLKQKKFKMLSFTFFLAISTVIIDSNYKRITAKLFCKIANLHTRIIYLFLKNIQTDKIVIVLYFLNQIK